MILKWTAYTLFYGYALLLVAAGAWGVLFGAYDQEWLLGVRPGLMEGEPRSNVLSQYRFLRGIEFGFGLIALKYRAEIFSRSGMNSLFLTAMGAGILGRAVSVAADGRPRWGFVFFLAAETAGLVAIFLQSRHGPVRAKPS